MADDLQRFVDYLEKSHLLRSVVASAADFAEILIEHELLTRWQAEKLLDGKFKGFYLDDYVLIDHHHIGEERSYYVASHVKTKEKVVLGVQPISRNVSGDRRTHYEVLPFEDD